VNIKVYNPKDFPNYLPKLNALYDDLFHGGKGFRSLLTQKIAGPLGLSQSTITLLCQTVEFIHNASLLHDDLVDRSVLRRGKPAAWHKYTPEYAVLAGDYLLARVMCNLSEHGNIQLVQLTSRTIGELLEGEWIQDSLVGDFTLSFEQLTEVHSLKTATLFRWCLVAPFVAQGQASPELQKVFAEMGSILGLLFQRSDDLLDFDIRNAENKTVLGDLRSGYLNSFGAFLTEGWSTDSRKALKDLENIADVRAAVTEELFEKRAQEFDQVNEELIGVYNHHLDRLQDVTGEMTQATDVEALQANLRGLPELLYWRKQKGSSRG